MEDSFEVSQTSFSVYEPDRPALMSLLYQTGYLTIKEARQEGEERVYRLGCPNYEVRKAFNESLSVEFSRALHSTPICATSPTARSNS